jgi:DNA uptake protein ComE-like DNA-binding protein
MKAKMKLAAVLIAGTVAAAFPVSLRAAETTKPAAPDAKKSSTKPDRLDINTASVEQLKTLPGLNEAQAKKIVEGRPYKRRNELVTKKVLPQETYDKIKGQVSARSAADATNPASKTTPPSK